MTKEVYEDFDKSTICRICEKTFEEGDVKVKGHNHINQKHRDVVHQK